MLYPRLQLCGCQCVIFEGVRVWVVRVCKESLWEDGQVCVIVARPLVGGVVRIYESGYSVRRSKPRDVEVLQPNLLCVRVFITISVATPRERCPSACAWCLSKLYSNRELTQLASSSRQSPPSPLASSHSARPATRPDQSSYSSAARPYALGSPSSQSTCRRSRQG